MTTTVSPAETTTEETLQLAREAVHAFHAQCFWFWRRDFEITAEHVPLIVRGLRLHGGHRGMALAARLCR